ncbi:hypothetical protein OKW45_002716 [Paraburkholderia sp. WSM4175]|uniref:DUF4238 domain-containing protein n=1 Tax=Paraburkholderia sp. WSM4175 TaxID=2991072 RepID=UPI003D1A30CA
MTEQQKPKRRHHHVWQLYLRPWTTCGSIWCLQNDRVFPTGTTRVAVEKDFYKFQKLTAADEQMVQLMFEKSHPSAQRSFQSLVDKLMSPFREVEAIPGAAESKSITRLLDGYASNVLEELHSNVEARFIPLLKCALDGDISFYDDKRCIAFLDFLTKQHMRTKGIKERVAATIKQMGDADIRRAWSMLSFMFAQNVGASLYRERKRRRLALLRNHSNIPFITGDQPVINLRPMETQTVTIFYPLSPQLALWLGEVDEVCPFLDNGLSAEQVALLNLRVVEASYQQIFANEPAVLEFFARPPLANTSICVTGLVVSPRSAR